MGYTAFVFARGGSKGLPGKNILPLAGRPLIAWSIETALNVDRVDRVIVSTDSDEIAAVARECGAQVPFMRPAHLAADDSPEWLAWRHALQFLADTEGQMPPALLSVPTTSPLRSGADIDACLDEFEQNEPDAVITVTPAHRNPWFNMVKVDENGWVHRLLDSQEAPVRRQDGPIVLDITTVAYVVSSRFVMESGSLFDGTLRSVEVPYERSIDIDGPLDFMMAECLLHNRVS